MTKRRLTRAQQSQQKSIQAKRIKRAFDNPPIPEQNTSSLLGSEQPGLLIAHYGTTLIVENQAGKLFRCTLRQNLGTLVTGDRIIWQQIDEATGIVVAGLARHSVLTRSNKRDSKPIAANVDQMVIVLALSPLPQPTTLDRYLVLAQSLNVKATIVINKCDLRVTSEQQMLLEKMPVYQQIGYPWVRVSNETKEGLDNLQNLLKDQISVLVGQSGAGKSSLLNSLVPDAAARINELSARQCLGQHTTTASRLYHLPQGGEIIDSPGIHQFNLKHFSKKTIENGFIEFTPYLNQCRFRDCQHDQEPDCALQMAIKMGRIASFRLKNYHTILKDLP